MTPLDDYISKVEAGFPLTNDPQIIPEIQDQIVSRMTCGTYKSFDKVGISLGTEGVQHAHSDSLVFIQDHMNWFFTPNKVQVIIPKNALTVSFAMPNFALGDDCQEFYPKHSNMPVVSYFTYRMLSKQCQATYYNEGGVQFLAGICYYLQLKGSSLLTTEVDKFAMSDAVGSDISYPHVDRRRTWRFVNQQRYGRDCKTAGKRVQVYFGEGMDHVHRVYNYRDKKFEYKECEECREEAKMYKFVKVPATVTPIELATVTQKSPMENEMKQLGEQSTTVTQKSMMEKELEQEKKPATVTPKVTPLVKEEAKKELPTATPTSDDEFDFVEDIDLY